MWKNICTNIANIVLNKENGQDPRQRDDMMDDFKKSFVKVKAKKKVKEKVVKEVEDQNKEHLKGDFRTLIDRLLDSKVETVFFIYGGYILHKTIFRRITKLSLSCFF